VDSYKYNSNDNENHTRLCWDAFSNLQLSNSLHLMYVSFIVGVLKWIKKTH